MKKVHVPGADFQKTYIIYFSVTKSGKTRFTTNFENVRKHLQQQKIAEKVNPLLDGSDNWRKITCHARSVH